MLMFPLGSMKVTSGPRGCLHTMYEEDESCCRAGASADLGGTITGTATEQMAEEVAEKNDQEAANRDDFASSIEQDRGAEGSAPPSGGAVEAAADGAIVIKGILTASFSSQGAKKLRDFDGLTPIDGERLALVVAPDRDEMGMYQRQATIVAVRNEDDRHACSEGDELHRLTLEVRQLSRQLKKEREARLLAEDSEQKAKCQMEAAILTIDATKQREEAAIQLRIAAEHKLLDMIAAYDEEKEQLRQKIDAVEATYERTYQVQLACMKERDEAKARADHAEETFRLEVRHIAAELAQRHDVITELKEQVYIYKEGEVEAKKKVAHLSEELDALKNEMMHMQLSIGWKRNWKEKAVAMLGSLVSSQGQLEPDLKTEHQQVRETGTDIAGSSRDDAAVLKNQCESPQDGAAGRLCTYCNANNVNTLNELQIMQERMKKEEEMRKALLERLAELERVLEEEREAAVSLGDLLLPSGESLVSWQDTARRLQAENEGLRQQRVVFGDHNLQESSLPGASGESPVAAAGMDDHHAECEPIGKVGSDSGAVGRRKSGRPSLRVDGDKYVGSPEHRVRDFNGREALEDFEAAEDGLIWKRHVQIQPDKELKEETATESRKSEDMKKRGHALPSDNISCPVKGKRKKVHAEDENHVTSKDSGDGEHGGTFADQEKRDTEGDGSGGSGKFLTKARLKGETNGPSICKGQLGTTPKTRLDIKGWDSGTYTVPSETHIAATEGEGDNDDPEQFLQKLKNMTELELRSALKASKTKMSWARRRKEKTLRRLRLKTADERKEMLDCVEREIEKHHEECEAVEHELQTRGMEVLAEEGESVLDIPREAILNETDFEPWTSVPVVKKGKKGRKLKDVGEACDDAAKGKGKKGKSVVRDCGLERDLDPAQQPEGSLLWACYEVLNPKKPCSDGSAADVDMHLAQEVSVKEVARRIRDGNLCPYLEGERLSRYAEAVQGALKGNSYFVVEDNGNSVALCSAIQDKIESGGLVSLPDVPLVNGDGSGKVGPSKKSVNKSKKKGQYILSPIKLKRTSILAGTHANKPLQEESMASPGGIDGVRILKKRKKGRSLITGKKRSLSGPDTGLELPPFKKKQKKKIMASHMAAALGVEESHKVISGTSAVPGVFALRKETEGFVHERMAEAKGTGQEENTGNMASNTLSLAGRKSGRLKFGRLKHKGRAMGGGTAGVDRGGKGQAVHISLP